MTGKYCCPSCKEVFDEEDIFAFREDGKWVPMCPDCQYYQELRPLGESGWYITIRGEEKIRFLGSDEEVYKRLVAGETLYSSELFGQNSNRRVCMHDIILEEIEFGNMPPSFFSEADGDFNWGVAWLDGKLEGYTPAQYLRDMMDDEELRKNGLLDCNMIYLGAPDLEEGRP